jgi:hypothetical protein
VIGYFLNRTVGPVSSSRRVAAPAASSASLR